MEHKTLVDAVVTAEWEMFSNVQNVGGKASCQMDPKTFRIMRSSQMDNWDDELLGSYLEDLLNARLEGRNLVTEKYARMMESTVRSRPRRLLRQPCVQGPWLWAVLRLRAVGPRRRACPSEQPEAYSTFGPGAQRASCRRARRTIKKAASSRRGRRRIR